MGAGQHHKSYTGSAEAAAAGGGGGLAATNPPPRGPPSAVPPLPASCAKRCRWPRSCACSKFCCSTRAVGTAAARCSWRQGQRRRWWLCSFSCSAWAPATFSSSTPAAAAPACMPTPGATGGAAMAPRAWLRCPPVRPPTRCPAARCPASEHTSVWRQSRGWTASPAQTSTACRTGRWVRTGTSGSAASGTAVCDCQCCCLFRSWESCVLLCSRRPGCNLASRLSCLPAAHCLTAAATVLSRPPCSPTAGVGRGCGARPPVEPHTHLPAGHSRAAQA